MFKRVAFIIVLFILFQGAAAMQPSLCEGENIIQNPGFEESEGSLPAGWYTDAYLNSADAVSFRVEEGEAHSGAKYAVIENLQPNDSRFVQDILIEPGAVYKLSCWVKADNIETGGGGINITLANGIFYSDFTYNTGAQWSRVEYYVRTREDGDEVLKFWIRLGGYGAVVKGKVCFDDVTVERVENPDPSIRIIDCFSDTSGGTDYADTNEGHRKGAGSYGSSLFYMLGGIVLLGLIIFAEVKLVKCHKAAADGREDGSAPVGDGKVVSPRQDSGIDPSLTDYIEDTDIKD